MLTNHAFVIKELWWRHSTQSDWPLTLASAHGTASTKKKVCVRDWHGDADGGNTVVMGAIVAVVLIPSGHTNVY